MDSNLDVLSMNYLFILLIIIVNALSGFGVGQESAKTLASFQQVYFYSFLFISR